MKVWVKSECVQLTNFCLKYCEYFISKIQRNKNPRACFFRKRRSRKIRKSESPQHKSTSRLPDFRRTHRRKFNGIPLVQKKKGHSIPSQTRVGIAKKHINHLSQYLFMHTSLPKRVTLSCFIELSCTNINYIIKSGRKMSELLIITMHAGVYKSAADDNNSRADV